MGKTKQKADASPAPKASDMVKVYQLKITLRHITPLIWRRVLLKSDTTIAQMHNILQTVMGWEDLHLHLFQIHGKDYGIYRSGGISFADNPHQVKLRDFKLRKSERFVYEYDMGDWWLHDIRLEQVLPLEPKKQYGVFCPSHRKGIVGRFPTSCGHGKQVISGRKEITASDPAFSVSLTGKTLTETTHAIRRHMNCHENTSERGYS